jgi:hypothetical protein
MELAIPLVALGGMYVIANQNSNKKDINSKENKDQKEKKHKKENFDNMGIRTNLQVSNYDSPLGNYLPNTNIPPQNYPITNNNELVDTVYQYPNPNVATDNYLNQNIYEEKTRAGVPVGDKIQEFYSLSGDYLNTREFTHNNMVPFTGKKPFGQVYNSNNAETILDNMVGNGSQVIKKIEQAPLFKPQENIQWPFGMPDLTDFFQSRQNPILKNHSVLPFEAIMVGPGLDKGFSAEGSHGYNSGMEARDKWLPKTVDELRVTTNPKQEYNLNNLQGPAQALVTNVGIEGKMEKYRPDTFFINSQDRWFTTTGAEKAGPLIAEEIIKESNRNLTTTHQHGTPNSVLKTASYIPTLHEETKRIQLPSPDVGHSNASGTAPHHDKDFYQKSHTNYANNRSTNNQPTSFGSGFTRSIGAVIAPIMDILKPSRKEEYSPNIRIYGNQGTTVPSSYLGDLNNPTATTIKETTIYKPNGYISHQKDNAGYLVNPQQPITNQRDTVNHNQLLGIKSKSGNKQYDYVYRQTNNDTKERVVINRTNQGNTNQFNPTVNVSLPKVDSDRNNNRLWAPSIVVPSGPSVQTYGKANMPQYNNECISCDRIAPDLLNAFKSNPYTQSLASVR